MIVNLDVNVIVDAPVMVAALVSGNETVVAIDTVDAQEAIVFPEVAVVLECASTGRKNDQGVVPVHGRVAPGIAPRGSHRSGLAGLPHPAPQRRVSLSFSCVLRRISLGAGSGNRR